MPDMQDRAGYIQNRQVRENDSIDMQTRPGDKEQISKRQGQARYGTGQICRPEQKMQNRQVRDRDKKDMQSRAGDKEQTGKRHGQADMHDIAGDRGELDKRQGRLDVRNTRTDQDRKVR